MKKERNDARKEARELKKQLSEREAKDEQDKVKIEAEREALEKANRRILHSEIRLAAKGVLEDPNDAFKYLDLDQFEVSNEGDVDQEEIASAVADLVEQKPYLAAQGGQAVVAPDPSQGAKRTPAGKQIDPLEQTVRDKLGIR
jgi:hypothetical protein